jgi:DNA polymerase phi
VWQLHTVPHPALSDAVHASSRSRLSTILAELATESTLIKGADGKQKRAVGCDSTGTLWTSRALAMVSQLNKDRKHIAPATEEDADVAAARQNAHAVLATLDKVPAAKQEAARGLQLLIQSVILQSYDDAEASLDVLEELESCATRMFAEKPKMAQKKKAAAEEEADADEEDLAPIDILVDVLIGFLEKSSSQLRALASQVFGVLSGEATESTIDLLLAVRVAHHLSRRTGLHDN